MDYQIFDFDSELVASHAVDLGLGFDQSGTVDLYQVASGVQPQSVGQITGVFSYDYPGFVGDFAEPIAIDLVGPTLWVYNPQSELLRRIDVSDPSNIPDWQEWPMWRVSLIGTPLQGAVPRLDIEGDRAYLVNDGGLGIAIADVSGPSFTFPANFPASVPVELFEPGYMPSPYAREGALIALRATGGDLAIWDLADASMPQLLSQTEFPGGIDDLSFSSATLMITGGGGTSLVDVSTPATPTVSDLYPGCTNGHLIDDQLVGSSGTPLGDLIVYDLRDPDQPVIVAGAELGSASFFGGLYDQEFIVAPQFLPDNTFELVVAEFGCELGAEYDIVLTEDALLESGGMTVDGVPLANARILINGSGLPFDPLGTFPDTVHAGSINVIIEGDRVIDDLVIAAGASVTIRDDLTGAEVFVFESSIQCNGLLVVDAVHVRDSSQFTVATDGTTGTSILGDVHATTGSHLEFSGTIRGQTVWLSDADLVLSGSLVVDDISAVNGSTITHDAEATTEAP